MCCPPAWGPLLQRPLKAVAEREGAEGALGGGAVGRAAAAADGAGVAADAVLAPVGAAVAEYAVVAEDTHLVADDEDVVADSEGAAGVGDGSLRCLVDGRDVGAPAAPAIQQCRSGCKAAAKSRATKAALLRVNPSAHPRSFHFLIVSTVSLICFNAGEQHRNVPLPLTLTSAKATHHNYEQTHS